MQANNLGFCLVETIEAGQKLITTVPQLWVDNGILRWPNSINASALVRDETCKPQNSWTKLPCKIKHMNIKTYEEGEMEAENLSGHDTDTSTVVSLKKRKITNRKTNFNSILKECNRQEGPLFKKVKVMPSCTATETDLFQVSEVPIVQLNLIEPDDERPQAGPSNVITTNDIYINSPEPDELQQVAPNIINANDILNASFINMPDPDAHGANLEKFKQEIIEKIDSATSQILNSVGELMAKTIAAIKTDFDIKLAAISENRPAVQSTADLFQLEPVSSKAELENLEENLQTPEFEEQVVQYMNKIIGNSVDTRGMNTCYVLLDHFFNRKFMVECSWSGMSRSNEQKSAIKMCKNILRVFLRIIRQKYEHFSELELQNFFKLITKNSKKRSQMSGLRQSSTHIRQVKKQKETKSMTEKVPQKVPINSDHDTSDDDEDDDS